MEEEQQGVDMDILRKYATCMEEIKLRMAVVERFLRGELHARYLQMTVECICLQIRKILELIALASLVANKSEYEKYRENFQNDWKPRRIAETLDKANPEFYPRPGRQVVNPETGKVEVELITSGYLSRADYVDLYGECSKILHAANPFSGREQEEEARSFLASTPEWMEKIRALLSHQQNAPGLASPLWGAEMISQYAQCT